jgi:hypothetical protein
MKFSIISLGALNSQPTPLTVTNGSSKELAETTAKLVIRIPSVAKQNNKEKGENNSISCDLSRNLVLPNIKLFRELICIHN